MIRYVNLFETRKLEKFLPRRERVPTTVKLMIHYQKLNIIPNPL